MKKIIKEATKEVAEYRSDFSGKNFAHGIPPARVVVDFGYGSQHDGARLELELSDGEAGEVIDFLSTHLCKAAKAELRRKLRAVEGGIDGAIEARSWQDAETLYAGADMYRRLLGGGGK